jgi:hypothetical protein
LTIALMLALGFTTRYSGTDTTMGLAMAGTGWWFPFFSPLIGWLGVALTGSDTSSNVLFGNLQKVSAEQLGLSPILMAAANSSGGVMGKMIDAQSIVVASVATGGRPDSPDAGTVLRSVFWHSVALALLVGVLVMLRAYVWPAWCQPLVEPAPEIWPLAGSGWRHQRVAQELQGVADLDRGAESFQVRLQLGQAADVAADHGLRAAGDHGARLLFTERFGDGGLIEIVGARAAAAELRTCQFAHLHSGMARRR